MVASAAATIPPPCGEGPNATKADACDPLPTDGKDGGGEMGEGTRTFAGTPAAPGLGVCVLLPICDAMCDVGVLKADTEADAPTEATGTWAVMVVGANVRRCKAAERSSVEGTLEA